MANKNGKNSPFVPGNKLWQLHENPGRQKTFKKPEDLWTAAVAYFEWCENNPLYEERGFAFQGSVTREKFSKMRAMTVQGLCLHLGITPNTFRLYRSEKGYEEYHETADRIMDVIYEQKFTGAAAELLNPNIISRDLNLAEKQEVSSNLTVVIEGDDADL